MGTKIALAMSFLSIIATTSVVHTSNTFADHGQPAAATERIGHGGSTYSFYTHDGAAECQFTEDKVSRADVSERIGHGGSIYSFTRLTPSELRDCHSGSQRVTVMERVGHGGSLYSFDETMTN